MYRTVVALTVFAHFAFLGYLIVGGFLALRWRWTFWLHIPTVLWGVTITIATVACPLTWLERWARAKGGMDALPSEGFVAHYITGVLYPADWTDAVEIVVFVIIAVSWVLLAWCGRRRDVSVHRTGPAAPD